MYIVTEIQDTGAIAILNYTYESYDEACSKYHSILSFAATSSVKKHTALIMTSDATVIKRESYEH